METNFTAAWRKQEGLNPAGESPFSSPAAVALKTNFNAIADEDALGTPSRRARRDPASIDVACYYHLQDQGEQESGPINVTGCSTSCSVPAPTGDRQHLPWL
jgi:hypothetical protein